MRKSGNKKAEKSKSKRLLAVCLSVSMILGSVSAFALADDEEQLLDQEPVQIEEPTEAAPDLEEPSEVDEVSEEPEAVLNDADAEVPDDGEDVEDDAVQPEDVEESEVDQLNESNNESVVVHTIDMPTYNAPAETSTTTPSGTTLTVADGENSSNQIPFYRWYKNAKTQFIVPAAQLSAMNGATINAIEFYMTAVNDTDPSYAIDGNCVIILSEVSSTTMTSLIDVSASTVAFSGNIQVSRGKKPVTINLTTPYQYGGGNLLVTTICNSSAYNASAYYYGVETSGAACYSSSDSGTYYPDTTGGSTLSFMPKTTFYYGDIQATVTTAPAANDLEYNGSSQELVTAGVASGGTMAYALGSDSTTAPTSGWDDEIPSAEDAGTYYVWYKAVGSKEEFDSDPECVEVTIDKADSYDTHFPLIVERNAAGEVFLQDSSLALLTYAGNPVGGTEMYSLDGENYSTEIPTVTSAGEYRIYLMIKGDSNHNDCDYGPSSLIYVVDYAFAAGADSKWEMDSNKTLTFTVKRSRLDELTFGNVEGVYVDDTAVPDSSYGLEQGSAIITLSAEYLKTLAEGKHTFKVVFTDPYTVTTNFTIAKSSPQTGEYASPLIIALSGLFLAAGAVFVVKSRKA